MERTDVELVVFDLGGVLVRVAGSWEITLERAGLADRSELLGRVLAVDWAPLIAAHESGRTASHEFGAEVCRLLALEATECARMMDAWLVGPYRGVDELLDRLGAAGVSTACLSNTNPRHWQLMTGRSHPASMPLDRLDFCFPSHQIGAVKPTSRAYEQVELRTGVPPEAMLFYDDREENVAAARARGWQAEVVDPEGDPVAEIVVHLESLGVL